LAKSLALGGIELSNVAFLVASNDNRLCGYGLDSAALVGLPVLRALGSITWTREGMFEADRSSALEAIAANICFDDLNVITQARFEGKALPFVLDTGAETSEPVAKMAGIIRGLIRKSGTHESHAVNGMAAARSSRRHPYRR